MIQKNTPNSPTLLLMVCFLAMVLLPELSAQTNATSKTNRQQIAASTAPIHFPFVQKVSLWGSLLPTKDKSAATPLPSFTNAFLAPAEKQPYAYNPQHLAFFCRLEVKLEKATKIPVRFRIGDVQQVDYLEGKFTGWRYGY